MTSQETFSYENQANRQYPLNSPKAEHARMDQLERELAANGACPNGYVINKREHTAQAEWGNTVTYSLFYEGRCK